MNTVLFVGNGPNLIFDKGNRWDQLLNQLAGSKPDKFEQEIRDAKPFTLWFEEIKNKSGSSADLPKKVTELLSDLSANDIHRRLMTLPIEHILTTNYDYALEDSIDTKWESAHTAAERTYSLFRRRINGDKQVWHVHGEIANSRTIMLGHDLYIGYIQKIGNFLSQGVSTEVKERKKKPYLSKFAKKKKAGSNNKHKDYVQSWVDLFLENDVHMIGFSLDYTENHLWNLIRKKQSLRKKGEPVGQLTFHRCAKKKRDIRDEARMSLLESFGVTVCDHQEKNYEEAYKKAIVAISDSIKIHAEN